MSLSEYKKKRSFNKTPEPEGKTRKTGTTLKFVIQKHQASSLHYDFRLEMEGVLKSWAVPKGPSLNPADKRLAMMVEDHPYDYGSFSGVIPEGNYGAGIVEIWDHGTLTDLEGSSPDVSEKRLRAGLKAGNLKFRLKGRKLKGEFALVKMKNAEGNAWLLIKHRDEFAVEDEYNAEVFTPKSSRINKWLQQQGKPVPALPGKKVRRAAKKATPKKRVAKKKHA